MTRTHRGNHGAEFDYRARRKDGTWVRLAAGIAHEINSPVGYVASNLHMLGHCRVTSSIS